MPPPTPPPSPLALRSALFLSAAAPLIFSNAVVAVFTLPKLAVLSGAALLAGASGLWGLRSPAGVFRGTPLDPALAAAAASLLVSTIFSWDPRLSILGMYNYYAYGLWGLGLVASIYCAAASIGEAERENLLKFAAFGAALSGLYAVLQVQGVEPFPQVGQVLTGRRAISTQGSPVSLGAYLALFFPLAAHWAGKPGGRFLGWAGVVLLGGGLLASGSRAAWLSAGAGAAVALWGSGPWGLGGKISARKLGLAAAILLASGTGIAVRLSGRTQAAGVDSARLEVWKIAWNCFRDNPWIGIGPDAFELYFRKAKTPAYIQAATAVEYQAHAHNDILEALTTTGALGGAAYALLLYMVIKAGMAAWSDPARRSRSAALAGGLLALFINMKFNPIPLEVLAAGALLAGALAPARGTAGRLREIASAAVLAAFGLAAASGAWVLVRADAQVKDAQRLKASGRPELAQRRLEAALALRPCELAYSVEYANFLHARAASISEPAVRLQLLDLGAAAAEKAAACHPASPIARYALGVCALFQAQAGRPERLSAAEMELDRALELDPLFVPILRARARAALVRGDNALFSALEEKSRSLEGLSRR